MKRAIEYQASDGTRHEFADQCRAHERELRLKQLVHMGSEQVKAAIDRTDILTADAIEFAGKIIAEKRRADGDLKRKRKTENSADVATTFRARND